MRKLKVFRIILLLGIFLNQVSFAEWKLAKDECGVKISLSKVPHSSIKKIRMSGIIAVKPEKVIKVLMTPQVLPLWHHGVVKAKKLKDFSKNKILVYMGVKFPWPLKNRESIASSELVYHKNGGIIKIKYYPHKKMNKRAILMNKTNGYWKVSPHKKGSFVEFQMHSELGGIVPAFLINMFITKAPYETFLGLRRYLKTGECER